MFAFASITTKSHLSCPPIHLLNGRSFHSTTLQRGKTLVGKVLGPYKRWLTALSVGSVVAIVCYSADSETESTSSFAELLKITSRKFSAALGSADLSNINDRKLSLPQNSTHFLFGDSYRRKIFFSYEKRIRLRSPPEKVFEYFASHKTPHGELMMKPADLMKAVVPVFPPSDSNLVREGYLKGERSPGELQCEPSEFFMLFDVNNDGLISFKEYIFFVTLMSIPESSFSVAFRMFDSNNDGEIDKNEFKKVMTLMRAQNRQGAVQKDGLRAGLKVTGHVEDGGLVEYFFGKDGNSRLQLDKFAKFLKDLDEEILRLEFAHYDYKSQQTISAKDFALSMVAAADMRHLDNLLQRVDELSHDSRLRDVRITFEEFKSFADLRKKLIPFSLALFSYGKVNGLLTRADFKRAATQVCGIHLSDNVVDIVYHIFDMNRDGNLSFDEFLTVLYQREHDITQPVESSGTEVVHYR